jgi:Redoxin
MMLRAQSALLIGALVAAMLLTCSAAVSAADDFRGVTVTDLDGRAVRPFASSPAGARAVVFVFTRSDCPISNRYAPDLRRLQQQATAARIDFWIVFVDPAESAARIREHLKRFAYTGRALRDPRHDLVRASGATIAPEAAVFVREHRAPRLVYRGRIDDRYQTPGRMRPAATTRDLEAVLHEVRDAGPLVLRETQAVGCIIADLR